MLFENRLNHTAAELLGDADAGIVEHVVDTHCSTDAFDDSSWDDENADPHHLYWKIDGTHRPTLCPWLARALLVKTTPPTSAINCVCCLTADRWQVRCCALASLSKVESEYVSARTCRINETLRKRQSGRSPILRRRKLARSRDFTLPTFQRLSGLFGSLHHSERSCATLTCRATETTGSVNT